MKSRQPLYTMDWPQRVRGSISECNILARSIKTPILALTIIHNEKLKFQIHKQRTNIVPAKSGRSQNR